MLYIAIDGDNIGATVERHVILEEAEALSCYAESVNAEIAGLGDELRKLGASIIFCGGDSILAEFSNYAAADAIKQLVGRDRVISISVGAGASMREAYLALKMAKSSGKGCWVWFDRLDESAALKLGVQPND